MCILIGLAFLGPLDLRVRYAFRLVVLDPGWDWQGMVVHLISAVGAEGWVFAAGARRPVASSVLSTMQTSMRMYSASRACLYTMIRSF